MNINHTRDLVRLGNSFYDTRGVSDEKREADLKNLALCTWAFVRSMKRHLSPEDQDESAFRVELYSKLPKAQAEAIIDAAHRPNRALQDLSLAIENLPMHFMRKNEIQKAVTIFEDNLGSSERLLTSPVPLFYSRHTARFLSFWLLLLPLALYEPFGNSWNHVGLIPATALISVFLFGIEELATQLEEPFTILPMQTFCDKIYNWCTEIVSWSAGDNGMVVKEPRPEHSVAFTGPAPPASKPRSEENQFFVSKNEELAQQAQAVPAPTTDAETLLPDIPMEDGQLKPTVHDNSTEECEDSGRTEMESQGAALTASPSLEVEESVEESFTYGFLAGPVAAGATGALPEVSLEENPEEYSYDAGLVSENFASGASETSAGEIGFPMPVSDKMVVTTTPEFQETSTPPALDTPTSEEKFMQNVDENITKAQLVFERGAAVDDEDREEATGGSVEDLSTAELGISPPGIRAAFISGGEQYINTRGDLLQPLFSEDEYTIPTSNSFLRRDTMASRQETRETANFAVEKEREETEKVLGTLTGDLMKGGTEELLEAEMEPDDFDSATLETSAEEVGPPVPTSNAVDKTPATSSAIQEDSSTPAAMETSTSEEPTEEVDVEDQSMQTSVSEGDAADQGISPPGTEERGIRAAFIRSGEQYIDTRGDLLQPLFSEDEYTIPISNSFLSRSTMAFRQETTETVRYTVEKKREETEKELGTLTGDSMKEGTEDVVFEAEMEPDAESSAEEARPPVPISNVVDKTPATPSAIQEDPSTPAAMDASTSEELSEVDVEDSSMKTSISENETLADDSVTEEAASAAPSDLWTTPTSTQGEIRTAVINGAPYIDTRSDLLQPLFTGDEYNTPVSNSFSGRRPMATRQESKQAASVTAEEKNTETTSAHPLTAVAEEKKQKDPASVPSNVNSRGLGSRGLRAVQRWKN